MSKSYLISFEGGIERETSITYFVEMALEDPEAVVYDVVTGEAITELPEAVEVAA